VTTADFHSFFEACAGVAGALVGLLFVAISVTQERLAKEGESQVHRVRAAASLTAFTNALTVSLFALIPGIGVGWTSFAVALVGLTFIAASLSSLIRLRGVHHSPPREALFLVGLGGTFVIQLIASLRVISQPGDGGAVQTVAILVAVCFLIGIARAWELIGGPEIGIFHEIGAIRRDRRNPGSPEDSVVPED
jgi:hypothetical protein